jgi:uncharacterized DUF497 family protein
MTYMKLQFDPAKARSNLKKHDVCFADAEGVFYDPLAIHKEDPYSENEDRWIAVGMGNTNEILVVVYTLRGDEIRLISVRRATGREVKAYEG